MISWRMAAGWVVALAVTTVLTWSIVGLADSQVGERLAAVAPPSTISSLVETSTTTSLASTTTVLSPTSSTALGSTSTSSATGSSAPTSTTSPTSSTTSTAESAWSVQTINSLGGTVVVRYRPGEVELKAATPAPGFAVEIDDEGPPRVRVEFDSNDVEVRVEARWENGSLDIDIDEKD